MIFKPELARKSVTGEKTQTRRLVKPGERLKINEYHLDAGVEVVKAVYKHGRLKWMTGHSYAIQPGRTKPAIGRLRLLDIRKERVMDISEADAIAEGVERNCPGNWQTCPGCLSQEYCAADGEYLHYTRDLDDFPAYSAVESLLSLFESINGKAALDKEVWVLTYEAVQVEV